MDVTRILEQDHRKVEDLFAQIERADGAARQPMIDELATSLRAHMELEERTLYPAMKPVTGAEAVQEGATEHDLARKVLADVLDLAPDEPGFGAALDSLKAGISHHVDEEEHDVFPELRRDGVQVLDEIASPFMTLRVELGLPVDADALVASSSKDELRAEAESADVGGAASMSKAELADALAEKMA
jgi:iron-sulfur cluster repair protein YtfE (RIC family)